MFRLVTQFCEKPAFLIVCDNLECGCTTAAEAIVSELNPITIPQQEVAFLEQCKRAGWLVSLRLSLCPGHYQQLQQFSAQRRSAIITGESASPATPSEGPAEQGGPSGKGGAGFSAE